MGGLFTATRLCELQGNWKSIPRSYLQLNMALSDFQTCKFILKSESSVPAKKLQFFSYNRLRYITSKIFSQLKSLNFKQKLLKNVDSFTKLKHAYGTN